MLPEAETVAEVAVLGPQPAKIPQKPLEFGCFLSIFRFWVEKLLKLADFWRRRGDFVDFCTKKDRPPLDRLQQTKTAPDSFCSKFQAIWCNLGRKNRRNLYICIGQLGDPSLPPLVDFRRQGRFAEASDLNTKTIHIPTRKILTQARNFPYFAINFGHCSRGR